MNVFVTGANGFVGRELLKQLSEKNISCVAVDLKQDLKLGVLGADIRSREISSLIPEGADAIIHLAGLTRDPDCKNRASECFDVNVMATLNLIDACEARQIKQFIFASTEWVYGPFAPDEVKDEMTLIDLTQLTSEYALSKLVSEANLRQKYAHGFCPVTILRFGIIYGPREKNWSAVESLFHAVKTKDEVQVGSLKTGRCFIHIEDIVSGIINSLGLEKFDIINLQGSRFVTLGDIIDNSKKILGRVPRIVETTPDNFNIRNISNKKAMALLHWKPSLELEEGLRTLV